ncbi:alpha/beta-hydrolase [Mollisia scopiformis]|uniref:Alpha/beta-hydrolase n=1 Tax=Mollisia scopiformis TaxID=149040 RepID=A0A132B7I9_MOLSC|nr:alpha/beta-hydrolase [Mollisia scopiformis]KUJ07637.1 alpha/beta-hydrolase [Mollisia scopiformis]
MPDSSAPTTSNLVYFGSRIASAAISRLLTAPFRWRSWNGAPVVYKDQEPKPLHLKENDTIAHWIGEEDADIVILFLHGGGYTQPCSHGHMQYFHRLVTDINNLPDSTLSITVLLLAYTLAPEAQFPTQLKQATTLLSYLLKEGSRPASSILIAGDSAGGGLSLSLLSHLLHPHPDIRTLNLNAPLRGVFLYSPWVSFDTSQDSYARNAQKDSLVPNVPRKWAGMYLGTGEGEVDPGITMGGDSYSEPLLGNASWWEGMHEVIRDVWIFGGKDEVFIDSMYAFQAKFCMGWVAGGGVEERVVVGFVEAEAHIGPVMDVLLQYKKKSVTQLRFEEWLKGCLAEEST